MKLVLNKKDFLKSLQIGGSFAGHSKTLPILDCVKIKVSDDGRCNIVSMDGENAISKKFNIGNIDFEGGTICVDFKGFTSYIKLIRDKEFVVETTNDDKLLVVRHSKGKTELPLMNSEEFPKMSTDGEPKVLNLDSAVINNWLVDSLKFISHDELRPIMTGVYFYYENGEFGYCASDGRKLITDNISLDLNCSRFEFVINANSINTICNTLQNTSDITVKLFGNNVYFVTEDTHVMVRLLDGRFPNFKSVIPKDNDVEVAVSKEEIISAIERCKLSANQVSNLIKIDVKDDNMTVESQDLDFSKKGIENVDCKSNKQIEIGFNGSSLIDCLSPISTDDVIIKLKNVSSAALMYESSDESKKEILLMPMLMQ